MASLGARMSYERKVRNKPNCCRQGFLVRSPTTNFLPAILPHYCILGVPKVLYFLMSKTQGLQQV